MDNSQKNYTNQEPTGLTIGDSVILMKKYNINKNELNIIYSTLTKIVEEQKSSEGLKLNYSSMITTESTYTIVVTLMNNTDVNYDLNKYGPSQDKLLEALKMVQANKSPGGSKKTGVTTKFGKILPYGGSM